VDVPCHNLPNAVEGDCGDHLIEVADPLPLGLQAGGEGAEDDAGLVVQGKDYEGREELLRSRKASLGI
jgi:hypothetical protein